MSKDEATLAVFYMTEDIRHRAETEAGHYEPYCLTDRKYPFLEPEQEIAYKWQTGRFGGFWMAFFDNVHRADSGNLMRLFKTFPVETSAIRLFYTVPGWYEEVEKLVEEFKDK